MILELINIFDPPFVEEVSKKPIANYVEGVDFVVNHEDDSTALGNYVDDVLKQKLKQPMWNAAFKIHVPPALAKYKKDYRNCDKAQADKEIKGLDITLTTEQLLYHGGVLNIADGAQTLTPLSTTFNPLVAFVEAKDRGKAFDAGVVHINILKIVNNQIKVYPYKFQNTLGHEDEVLLEAGVTLRRTKMTKICNKYSVCTYHKGEMPRKDVEVYVVEWNVT